MEKLNEREIAILRYLAEDIQYIEEGPDTYVKIPFGLTKPQFTTACDSLEAKGMIKTAYCEGHELGDVRVLDKGQCYLDDLAAGQERINREMPLSSFLSLFGTDGLAYKYLCLMEKKHGFFVERNDAERIQYKAKDYGNIDRTQIFKESANINFDMFDGQDIKLLDEVNIILENKSDDDLDRLLLQILNSLELFGRLLYPLARCRSHKLRIQDLIKKSNGNHNNTDYFERTIAYYKEEIRKIQNNSQNFKNLFVEDGFTQYLDFEPEWYMSKYMSLYISFVKNLDALLMKYGKDLLEFEHKFNIFLYEPMEDVDLCQIQHLSTLHSVKYYYTKLENRTKLIEKEKQIMGDNFDIPAEESKLLDPGQPAANLQDGANTSEHTSETQAEISMLKYCSDREKCKTIVQMLSCCNNVKAFKNAILSIDENGSMIDIMVMDSQQFCRDIIPLIKYNTNAKALKQVIHRLREI